MSLIHPILGTECIRYVFVIMVVLVCCLLMKMIMMASEQRRNENYYNYDTVLLHVLPYPVGFRIHVVLAQVCLEKH